MKGKIRTKIRMWNGSWEPDRLAGFLLLFLILILILFGLLPSESLTAFWLLPSATISRC